MKFAEKADRISLWTAVSRYPYTTAAVLVFISQAFPALLCRQTEWTNVFVRASKNLLAGQDILAAKQGYVYPPFFTLVSIPFTVLPQALSQLLFYLIGVACIVYVVKSAWTLSGGGRLQGDGEKVDRREHLVFLLAMFCAGRFLFNALSHLQTDLLLAALVMAGCVALRTKRCFLSATWIGLAAAIKCTPLLFAPYLAWRGKWLAALWLVALAVGLNFLPDLVNRPPSGGSWAVEWYTRYLAPIGQEDYVPGAWYTSISNNQSLGGAVMRIFATSLKRTEEGIDVVYKKSALSPTALRAVAVFVYAMVIIPSAYAMWRRRRMAGPARAAPQADALEFGIILLLMLLLSPNSSRAHFGVMLLPAFCVGRIALTDDARASWMLFFLATFASLISFNTPLNVIFSVTLWAGAVTMVALLLLAGCVRGLLQNEDGAQ